MVKSRRCCWFLVLIMVTVTKFAISVGLLLTGSWAVAAPVAITHYSYGAHGQAWADYLMERAKIFNAQNPDVQVEIQVSPGNEYVSKFQIMLAGGVAPDVTDFHPALGATFLIQNVFTDLRPYLERDGINLNRLTSPSVVEVLTNNDGAIWALPGDIYPVVTFYNADILANAGLPFPDQLGNNWTWEQALTMGKKTAIDANGDGINEQWGMDRMWARWYIWVHQAGGMVYDRIIDPTRSTWNDPRVLTGLRFPLTAQMDNISPKTNTPNYTQTYFWFGKTALDLVDGPGVIGAYLKDASFNWNIAPQVRGPENAGSEIALGAFQIVGDSKNKEAAWRWLKYISLDMESHARFVELTGRAPSLNALQSRYRNLCPYLPSNFMAFFQTAGDPDTKMNYVLLQSSDINAVVNPLITQAFLGQIPLETAVTQIHDLVSAILAEKGKN